MVSKDVKKNLLNHSEAKVRLLGEYLKRYLNIICNDHYTSRIKIYDLFCGEGLYENGGEGSPLVILRQVKDVHFINVSKSKVLPKIDCHFNDIDSNKVDKTKKSIKEKSLYYPEFGDISYSSNDYQAEFKKLTSELTKIKIRNQKAFVFIDPYEYKHIRASQIKELLQSGNSEILLWLPTQFMYRFAKNGTPESLKDFIEELDLFHHWEERNNVWSFIFQLREGFQKFLGTDFFVDTFSIRKDVNTVFCLFFFSSHIKGFEKMLEAKWEIDAEQGKGWNYGNSQMSLFQNFKTNRLEEKLKLFLKTEKFNGEVYEFTLREGFLPKHANEIFYNWQNDGLLEVKSVDLSFKLRKRAFYISYSFYRDEFKKIIFKLR